MGARLNPYLNFQDTARSAMEFYQGVFGGELTVNTFGEYGMGEGDEGAKIMHAQLETADGFTLMAADTPSHLQYDGIRGTSVSLSGDDGDKLHGWWEQLCAGGQVMMPLEKQRWGDEFGMCVDKFGVPWLVNISAGQG